MKIYYSIKCIGLASVIGWAILAPPFAAAADPVSVQAAMQSARHQGLAEAVINNLLSAGMEHGLTNAQIVELFSFISKVQEMGLPSRSFVEKTREGLTKRVDFNVLIAGLGDRFDLYVTIRRMLHDKYTPSIPQKDADLDILVESIDLGLPLAELKTLFNRSPAVPPAMLALAARNKSLLDQLGFEAELTDMILNAGLENQSFTPDWANLFKVAAAAKRKGISDRQFSAVVQQVLKEKGPLRRVLADLSFTSRDLSSGPRSVRPVDPPGKSQDRPKSSDTDH